MTLSIFLLSALVQAEPRDAAPATQPTDDFTRRMLSGEATESSPSARLFTALETAERQLAERRDSGEAARAAQAAALAALDELIEAAKNQDNTASSGKSSRRTRRAEAGQGQPRPAQPKPGDKSADTRAVTSRPAPTRTDRSGISADAGESARAWGFLPARDREELMQGSDERFPPKYREQIERYYRSLAEEE